MMTSSMLQPTDFALLARRAGELVGAAAQDGYRSCATALAQYMRTYFPALTEEMNPVARCLTGWDEPALRFVIGEYSAFSNAAIHMFLEARIRNRWPALTGEIIRNMDEEMGVLTRGIPHLELMRHGYRTELGIDTDGFVATAATTDFIDRMLRLFRDRDNAFLAGALLAFETTAVDEFRVVDRLLRRYGDLRGSAIVTRSLTAEYIAGHVCPEGDDPEMAHWLGMVDAVGAGAEARDLPSLARGFLSVCLELDCWWETLAQITLHQRVRDSLAEARSAPPDIYPSLLALLRTEPHPVGRDDTMVYAPVA